ncbi:Uncharacterized protein DBV15_11110 [Temnothorax longispinosus]|uniref:Uncharacterized protein n=1 Tax=Temnothorax longispinosus TaxID=300112 RepID=A0A4S2KYC4_9HYME|nr:Uncharacterized protein DBV15_11110 [Temnothorax longispinosus]
MIEILKRVHEHDERSTSSEDYILDSDDEQKRSDCRTSISKIRMSSSQRYPKQKNKNLRH